MSNATDKLKLLDMIALSENATGIDISHWQDRFDIDTPDRKKILEILDFVFLRAGSGTQDGRMWEDRRLRKFWNELLEHPEIIRGLYWYFSSHSPWEDQRDLVFDILDSLNGDWEMFALDIEKMFNEKSAGFALSAVRFMKTVQKRYPGKKVLLYAGKYDYIGWLKFYTNEVDNFPLWHAQYPWASWYTITAWFLSWWRNIFTALTKKPALPPSREGRYEIWQVGAKTLLGKELGVGSLDVDINITRRTKENFIAWLGIPDRWKPDQDKLDPPPEPPQEPLTLQSVDKRVVELEAWRKSF